MSDEERKQKDETAGIFSRAASTYDRIGPRRFSHFGERLVERAQLAPGARVLDVAAGRGAVLFTAAKRVGPRGSVIGIDLSSDMVRETAAEIQNGGWRNAEMRQMDAEQLQFPDAAFDWVLCGFALWMFPQPHRALREFYRVLKLGGRLGLTTWAEDSPVQKLCREVLRRHLPPQPPLAPRFDTTAQLETVLRQAGFEELRIIAEARDFIYTREEELWMALWSSGNRRQLEQMTGLALEQAKTDVYQQLQVLKQLDGIHAVYRALFAFGAKPSQ